MTTWSPALKACSNPDAGAVDDHGRRRPGCYRRIHPQGRTPDGHVRSFATEWACFLRLHPVLYSHRISAAFVKKLIRASVVLVLLSCPAVTAAGSGEQEHKETEK